MKLFIVTILFVSCNSGNREYTIVAPSSPPSAIKDSLYFDLLSLKNETLEAMKILGIDVRDSLQSDGKLRKLLVDTIDNNANIHGRFFHGTILAVNDDPDTRIYLEPVIKLRKAIDSVLAGTKGSSKPVKCLYKAIVCHELTHYFQKTWSPTEGDRTKLNRMKYITIPEEKEAFAVEAYIAIKSCYPDILEGIQKLPTVKNNIDLQEALIDYIEQSSHSGAKAIFNKFIVPKQ